MLLSQQTLNIEPMLVKCWASVGDGGPRFNQHWFTVFCLLGTHTMRHFLRRLTNDPSSLNSLFIHKARYLNIELIIRSFFTFIIAE